MRFREWLRLQEDAGPIIGGSKDYSNVEDPAFAAKGLNSKYTGGKRRLEDEDAPNPKIVFGDLDKESSKARMKKKMRA
jgi:hypothetical protein